MRDSITLNKDKLSLHQYVLYLIQQIIIKIRDNDILTKILYDIVIVLV